MLNSDWPALRVDKRSSNRACRRSISNRTSLNEQHDGWEPERHGIFSQGSLFSLSKNGVVRMLLRMLSACHPGNGSND